ncbi:glucosyltransferase [Fomitiporia mediterranea MF3/22]|uniref:glucosyltransferase n=1 Tax=Fomitiporia mediterranea (strain MF3/22) TaxID=694068 RepID=UPI000440928A|nr:glucosyltransferase [Fomitiporia mediterranea MF3/22]EJD04392.1 glucosyltransferase [Fomitiporia mediterranea MF3/22]
MSNAVHYALFCAASVILLKEINSSITEPYMDEPFHVPQAQAYCRGEWSTWDPKLTTPPGLYILSVVLSKLFLFKCTLPILRLTPLLFLVSLPIIYTRLLSLQRRVRPPNELLSPTADALALSLFPIAWFYGFLYYTDVPSLAFVLGSVVAAFQDYHTLAALLGLISCTFRQTNIIWVLYAFAYSQLRVLRYQRKSADPESKSATLYDPPALEAKPSDLPKILLSLPHALPQVLPRAIPYVIDAIIFAAFVYWNGGIVLGDKSNHIPALHIPQLYYFVGFTIVFGWPALVGGPLGVIGLLKEVKTRIRAVVSVLTTLAVAITIHFFTIHHPFLLSDNRHFTFYVWRRVFRYHPVVPYLFSPGYVACAWAWYIRLGSDQTFLQTIALPLFAIPTLVMTPLLEPRYFIIPYVLLRAQIVDMPNWVVWGEAAWYALINWGAMYIFLYMEREGVGRFMW